MTKGEIAKVFAVLKAAYPRQEISQATAEVYAQFLIDLGFDAVLRAVNEHVASSQYFPAISEIRKAATSVALEPAELAWGEVMDQVRRTGRYRMPAFSSPAIERAVRSLGWGVICNTDEDQLNALRPQFYRTYNAVKGQAEGEANHGRLSETSGGALRLVSGVTKQLKGE